MVEQERPLVGRQLGAGERHVDRGDRDGLAHLDEDDRDQRVARARQLEVVRDAGVVVAAAAVELADAVEVRAKHDRVEQGSRAPHREPWARLGDHRLAELGAPEDRRTAEAQRPQPPVACEIQLLELNRGRAERRERREQGDERGQAAHGASHVTGPVGSAIGPPSRPRPAAGRGALTVLL